MVSTRPMRFMTEAVVPPKTLRLLLSRFCLFSFFSPLSFLDLPGFHQGRMSVWTVELMAAGNKRSCSEDVMVGARFHARSKKFTRNGSPKYLPL